MDVTSENYVGLNLAVAISSDFGDVNESIVLPMSMLQL